MRTQRSILQLSIVLLPMFCCSCSMLLVNTVPTRTGRALQAGASRDAMAARLGHPQSSNTLPISATAKRFPTNQPACGSDEYRVTGLMQMPGDPYDTDWNMYPALFFLTAGLSEVFLFPYVAVDMTVRSFRDYEFQAWYDCEDRLVAFERRRCRD
jgi:hypothetical protein